MHPALPMTVYIYIYMYKFIFLFFFTKEINSLLCLPPSPSTQIRLFLCSKLIPRANLPNRDSEPGGKTGIVESVLPQTLLLPVTVRAYRWERPRCFETPSFPKPGGRRDQDHVHHHGSSHHHRPDPATEILQQNQTVSNAEDSRGEPFSLLQNCIHFRYNYPASPWCKEAG